MYFPSGDMTELVTGASGGFEVTRCSIASRGVECFPLHIRNAPMSSSVATIARKSHSHSHIRLPAATVKSDPLLDAVPAAGVAVLTSMDSPACWLAPPACVTDATNRYPLFASVSM